MGKRLRHRSRRGFTLIELTIALAIAAMMVGVTMISVQSLTHADLKNTSLELAGAVKYNYDRAIMEKRIQRTHSGCLDSRILTVAIRSAGLIHAV